MNYDPLQQGGAVGRSGVSRTRKGRFNRTQVIEILQERERGMKVAELCRQHGISPTTFYKWRAKFADPIWSEASSGEDKGMATLRDENRRLKKLLGEQVLDNSVLKEMLAKKRE